MIIKHGRHVFGEIHEMRKGLWAFLTVLFGCWLAEQANSDHVAMISIKDNISSSLTHYGTVALVKWLVRCTCIISVCLSVCLFVKRSIGLSRRMQKKGAGLRPFYSAPSCLKCMAIKCFKTTTTNEKSEHTSYVYYTKHCIAMSMSQLQLCDRHCDGQQCNILSVGQPASL